MPSSSSAKCWRAASTFRRPDRWSGSPSSSPRWRSTAAFRPFDDEALASSDLGRAAAGLLGSLSLFFVPAGVGVVQYLGLLREQGVALAAALVVSTLVTLVATVGVFVLVKRLIGAREGA